MAKAKTTTTRKTATKKAPAKKTAAKKAPAPAKKATTAKKKAAPKAPEKKRAVAQSLKPGESVVLTKPKRKKRVMTDDQKAAAAERLRKAREKRMAENPPQYKSIHPDVVALPEDATLSMKNVKEWIKFNKDLLAANKKSLRAGSKDAERKVMETQAYITNMETYLRTGTWNDLFYGERRNNRMQMLCTTLAYDTQGRPKRSVGTVYLDLGGIEWTQEMDQAERTRRAGDK